MAEMPYFTQFSANTDGQSQMTSAAPILVAITAFEGMSLLDLSGPLEALRVASLHPDHAGKPLVYETRIVSAGGGPVMTYNGVAIVTEPLSALDGRTIDTLICPGGPYAREVTADSRLTAWVKTRALECRRVCSVCTGSFQLAASGLLDGKRAVTHWTYCDHMEREHPNVKVEPDAIFVKDGKFWTSAGVTTGIDLALALVEEDFGRDVAMFVARILVVYLRRTGGQSQYSVLLAAQTESDADRFAQLDRWIAENLTQDLRVERLAERAGMSARNFARRYAQARNTTPARAVEAIRVDAARRALEETDERMGEIARRCGFSDEDQMRVAFARQIGIPPAAYRSRFAA
jgi:transcriptional regulator GlxA family with amidase domain